MAAVGQGFPVAPGISQRMVWPDATRGGALLLIAISNVMLYLHGRPYGFRQHVLEDDPLDRWAAAVVTATVEGRAYPLFGVLLGYGIARQLAGGAGAPERVRARGWALLIFGAAHALLLFPADILGLYGLITLALARCGHWSGRQLMVTAAALAVTAALVQGVTMAGIGPTEQRQLFWSLAIEQPLLAGVWRPIEWLMNMVGMLGVVAAVMVGVASGRRGDALPWLNGRRTSLWMALVLVGWLGGVPAALLVAGVAPDPGYGVAAAISAIHVLSGIVGGVALVALVAVALRSRRVVSSWGVGVLQAVGRRSLTCYLAQSALMVPLLSAWAGGLGAELDAFDAVLLACGVYALTVGTALVLERMGDARPAERLLRSLAWRLARLP